MSRKITIIRGDNRNIDVSFFESDGTTPINLTGATVYFTVNANNAPASDTGAAITKDVSIHTDPEEGETRISLSPADTEIAPGTYNYDVQLKDSLGTVTSQDQGKFIVKPDITRRA